MARNSVLASGFGLASRQLQFFFGFFHFGDVDLDRDETAICHAAVVGSDPAAIFELHREKSGKRFSVGFFALQIVHADIVADDDIALAGINLA